MAKPKYQHCFIVIQTQYNREKHSIGYRSVPIIEIDARKMKAHCTTVYNCE